MQINPCPHCGEAVRLGIGYLGQPASAFYVACNKCGAQGPSVSTQTHPTPLNEVITLWNQRDAPAVKDITTEDTVVFTAGIEVKNDPLCFVKLKNEVDEAWKATRVSSAVKTHTTLAEVITGLREERDQLAGTIAGLRIKLNKANAHFSRIQECASIAKEQL